MSTKEKIGLAIFFACLIITTACSVMGTLALMPQSPTATLGGSNGGPSGSGAATHYTAIPVNSNVACGTTSTLVQATSTSRNYLTMVNDSTSTTIYISEGQPAVGSTGIRLNGGGGSYEMNGLNMFIGSVYCIASSTAILDTLNSQ